MMKLTAIILVRDREALARGLRKLIGLPTLKRSTIALQRLTGSRSQICLPDANSVALCREHLGDIADYSVGTAELARKFDSQDCAGTEVLFLESDLVILPDTLKKFAIARGAQRLSVPGGLYILPGAQSLEVLAETQTPLDLLTSLERVPAIPFPVSLGSNVSRLDLPDGRPLGNKILSQSVRCSSTDSFLGALNRTIALPLTRGFARVGFSPNAVSFLALALAILGGWAFTQGTSGGFLSGALLTYLSTLLDFSDGDLARLTYRESKFGCWLDSACDYLSYFLTFGGIFIGAYRHHILPGYASLVSILSGCVISIVVFVAYRIWLGRKDGRPDQLDFHLQTAMKRMADDPVIRLANLLAKLPTRGDMTYILLGFALLGQIKAFLIFIAFAVHVVWILALYVGWRANQRGLFDASVILEPQISTAITSNPVGDEALEASNIS